MIMMNPNKDRVTTIVASIHKDKNKGSSGGGSEPREEYEEKRSNVSDSVQAQEAAMDSFIIAMDKKDGRGMARAMKTFLELCSYDDDKGENSGHENNPYDYDNRDKNPYHSG